MELELEEGDVGRIYVNHPALEKPVVVPPRPLNGLNHDVIMVAVENVLQSEENLDVTDGFDVQLGVARIERGGTNGRPITNVQDARFSKRAIVAIKNEDSLCLARALAVGIAKNNVKNAIATEKINAEKVHQSIGKGDQKRLSSVQKRKALEYHELAGVPTNRQCSLLDIQLFEDVLDVDVIVFAAHLNNKVLYPDSDQPKTRTNRVYLYYTKSNEVGHFDCIVNIKGMLGRGYFCHHCFKGFNNPQWHTCELTCLTCRSTSCTNTNPLTCRKCQTFCRSLECFERHRQPRKV